MEELLSAQEAEMRELEVTIKELLKSCKRGNKQSQMLEAQAIQMRFDMKAKHRNEVDELEEQLGGVHLILLITKNLSIIRGHGNYVDRYHNQSC